MNGPGPPLQVERRGATGPVGSGGVHSLVFFGGIIAVVGLVALAALAIWGPEKETTSRSHLASDPQPADSLPSLPLDVASDTPPAVAPVVEMPSAEPAADPPKKGKKKGGGKGKKR